MQWRAIHTGRYLLNNYTANFDGIYVI